MILSRAQSQQCRILGRVFERAGREGYAGRAFVDGFMESRPASDFFSSYDRLQWLGEGYLFDEIVEDLRIKPEVNRGQGALALLPPTNPEALYWTGYVYRHWGFATGESPLRISVIADAARMFGAWAGYHTLNPDEAIERLREDAAT